MFLTTFAKYLALALTFAVAVGGCGTSKSKESSLAATVAAPMGVVFQPRASLTEDAVFSLATNDLYDFVVDITACSSGFTYTVTSTTASKVGTVNLYKGDTDCLAGLKSFSWDGVSYTKSGGGNLTTGSAIFQNAGNTKQMQATVYVALDIGGIVASSKAHFVIGEIIKGGDYEVPVASYSEPTDILGTLLEAPNFTIVAATLVSVASGTGVPTMTIEFKCGGAVTGNNCASPTGVDQDMTKMSVSLVWDNPATYNGSLTYTQADTIVAALKTDIVGGMVGAVTGGSGANVTGVVGEGALDSKRNMLVVVKYVDPVTSGASYRYFNMDLAVAMNP